MKNSLIILLAALLVACSGVKNLPGPDITVPESYSPTSPDDSLSIADLNWFEFYADTVLCGFIRETLANNKDLQIAAARIDELQRIYGIEKLNILPTLSGNVYAQDETNDYSGIGISHDREFGVKVSVAWEVNLWGSFNWAKKKTENTYKASVEDYRALQMSLIAMTAETYYNLLALENEVAIVNRTVESRKESLRMARIRFEGGLTSETVYQQAKVEFSSAASRLPELKKRLAATRNALTVLMGRVPDASLVIGTQRLTPVDTTALPLGVPSDILQRRPDIRSAQLKLAASMANVGYTYAERFPSFRFGFTPGLENNELSHFLQSPFTFLVGSITGTIFDFGAKKKKYQAAKAVYEQSRHNYEKVVIRAFTEVNTAIEAYKQAQLTCRLKTELCEAAAKYIQLAALQYRAGTLNYIDVLDAQRRYFEAQVDVNNAVRDEYLAMIDLYKTLGGGWTTR